MTDFQYVQGPGYPLDMRKIYRRVRNATVSTTFAVGDIVMFDIEGSRVTDSTEEFNDSRTDANVIAPAAAGIGTTSSTGMVPGGWFGVVVDLLEGEAASGVTPGAATQPVKVLVRGRVKAKQPASITVAVGDGLVAADGAVTLTNVCAAGNKVIAIAEEAQTTTAGAYWCKFDGINGFGNYFAS